MMIGYYNGISGIKSGNFGIDVIANDISNINTVGYKSSTAEFKSILYQSLNQTSTSPVTSQIGLGSTSMATSLNFKQGSLQNTDKVFDLAIAGDGFFGLSGINGEQYFTRNGDFSKDVNGDIVNRNGLYLLGTMANLNGVALSPNAEQKLGTTAGTDVQAFTLQTGTPVELGASTAQTKIHLPDVLFLPATATTDVSFSGNLDSTINTETININLDNTKITSTINKEGKTISLNGSLADTPLVQNPNSPDEDVLITIKDANGESITTAVKTDANGNFSLNDFDIRSLNLDGELSIEANVNLKQEVPNTQSFSTDIISPNGNKNILKMEFSKQVPHLDNGTAWNVSATIFSPTNEVISTSNGVLNFNEKGALVSNTLGALDNDGAELNVNLGTPYDPNTANSGFDGMKSTGDQSLNLSVNKNGEAEGLLKEYTMNDNGEVVAIFDNGKMASVAKVALYHFQNNQGLSKTSENTYQTTANSGQPIFYQDQNGNIVYGAAIKNSTLEMSNVDLGVSLTDLIIMQKAYDASAKSITTSDQMIQKAINMKK
ncbi:flagellar hook-basal body complex protein [Campylobacter fetus]|uniref:Flagellar basal body rod protein FlgC n=1 Tax=Campylobacter fetus subsp. testudinum TaxID=1507806 RepID=A0AAX0HAG3_CAMFE|nr:flagellar hook-basal body complex protein [Campylobacter fetus]EAK0829946.1 flagellar hook-basal body complex protein [Campylobacter fetus]OCR85089.1 flagellar basal body rod protein FlgC [Campylobacter fetus subsp. testudinum]OCR88500.1 flagellar basal body rod protein FlgC [Campylobacter fetus subsp. testudinum]OCR90528.1 flagellar basal body rod protein FlgC [Campylobacter fetus subsp. testudinum]OCR92421.1 flagellar basal body rod protein FlgC [Campylobacter fetus subsp. testudinum]